MVKVRILLVVLAAFLQLTNFFNLFGVKPNFSLAVLAAIATSGIIFRDYLLLALLSAIFLKFNPGFDAGILAFAVTAFAVFAANNYLPWNRYINNIILIVAATLLLQILLVPIRINLPEVIYNVILGVVVLMILPKDYGQEKRFKF